MISLQDVLDAIDEVEELPDTYGKAEKLATFYTLRDALRGDIMDQYRAAPPKIEYHSDSEFGRLVASLRPEEVMPVIDELMDTLSIINPRLYEGVMNRFR